MSNLWMKIRIWTKAVLFVLGVTYALMFIVKNDDQVVDLWFLPFSKPSKLSLLILMAIIFGLGVVMTLLIGTARRTIKQIRDVRQKTAAEKLARGGGDEGQGVHASDEARREVAGRVGGTGGTPPTASGLHPHAARPLALPRCGSRLLGPAGRQVGAGEAGLDQPRGAGRSSRRPKAGS